MEYPTLMTGKVKRKVKHELKWFLKGGAWMLSAGLVVLILEDGWWKLIGVAAIIWMAASSIATFIDERRNDESNK